MTVGNCSWSFIRRRITEHFKMAFQKCKNIFLQAALKDFRSSANPKLKKISLSKLSLLQDHTEENATIRGSWELLLFSSDIILLHSSTMLRHFFQDSIHINLQVIIFNVLKTSFAPCVVCNFCT